MTQQEEQTISYYQKKYGNKWRYIAETMGTGRTGVEIKNYWHNKQQKMALKLLKKKV